jgi:hypothetical protein
MSFDSCRICWNFGWLDPTELLGARMVKFHEYDVDDYITAWWFQPTPLKNMSQLGWWLSQYMEK